MMAQVSSSFRDGFPISESLGHGAWDFRLRDLLLFCTWNESKFVERYAPTLFRSPLATIMTEPTMHAAGPNSILTQHSTLAPQHQPSLLLLVSKGQQSSGFEHCYVQRL